MRKEFALAAAIVLLCMVCSAAYAGWTVVKLHPAGATNSCANGVSGGRQVGYATIGGHAHAGLWSGTAASWVDLNPAGAVASYACGISGNQQVGYTDDDTSEWRYPYAGLWSGTAASWVELAPAGMSGSYAWGVSDGQQAGSSVVGSYRHASLWSGTAASWVDLNPAGVTSSTARCISGGQQAGYAWFGNYRHASLWSGTAASWVDLHPTGATDSSAYGISNGVQAGFATIGGSSHAGIWSGSAASWVDLNPAGATTSIANGISGGKQAGYAVFSGSTRAGLWSGTAGSWVNLHSYLSGVTYSTSVATGIEVVGDEIWVVGYARNTSTGQDNAILWRYTPQPVPSPTLSSIAPNSATNNGTAGVTITGTNFQSGAIVRLMKSGQADVVATGVTVVSPTRITCTFNLTGTELGQWNVVVTNWDSQTAILSNAFTVIFPAPTISSVTPNSGTNIGSVSITDLTGTCFQTGATAKLTKSGQPDVPATGVTVVSPTRITCTFNLTGTELGQWNVVVTNPDGHSGAHANGFTVTLPPPTLTSITPNFSIDADSIGITDLAGTYFQTGATVKLTKSGQADIAATEISVVSPAKITCNFDLAGKTFGQWNVVITNPDGQSATITNGFNVLFSPPSVSGIAPSSGQNTGTVHITDLSGTHFLAGATVKLTKSGQADIAATEISVVSPTSITCNFDLIGKAFGLRNVVVTNPDGHSATITNGFNVTVPAPTVSGITPSSGQDTHMSYSTEVVGTGFLAGATVKLTKSGEADIAATGVNMISPTNMTCSFSLAGGTSGQWNVVVTNPDAQSATLADVFTINEGPTAGAAKLADNGDSVSFKGFITATSSSYFYIEAPDRSSGIKVTKSGNTLPVGAEVVVSGTAQTSTSSGEKYVTATTADRTPGNEITILPPLVLQNNSVGGADWNYDDATKAGQKGIKGCVGLNNIGLLVTTAGIVTYKGTSDFRIDDGSGAKDNSTYKGVRVYAFGFTLPAVGRFARVTGISSCFKSGTDLYRVMIVRNQEGIVVY